MAATTIDAYLNALNDDRREAVEAVLDTIRRHLPEGYAEGIQYGMPSFFVPHTVYPHGYHCDPKQPVPFVGIASQKAHIGLYMFCIYTDDAVRERFVDRAAESGFSLDMGKSCIRFKRLEQIPLDAIGETIASIPVDAFLASYERVLPRAVRRRRGLPDV